MSGTDLRPPPEARASGSRAPFETRPASGAASVDDATGGGGSCICKRICQIFGRGGPHSGAHDRMPYIYADSLLGTTPEGSRTTLPSMPSNADMPEGTFLQVQGVPQHHQSGQSSATQSFGTSPPRAAPISLVGAVLKVRVLKAHRLQNMERHLLDKVKETLGDIVDPFVEVRVGDQSHRTVTIQNNQDPVWKDPPIFDFKLVPEDTRIVFEVFTKSKVPSGKKHGHTRGLAEITVASLIPGETVMAHIPLRAAGPGTEGTGELEVEVTLALGGRTPLANGDHVQVWSKSQQAWCNCTIDDIATEDCTKEGQGGHDYKVEAGAALVRFSDDKRMKWLSPNDHSAQLRMPYDWVVTKRGREVPQRAVCAGRTDNAGEMFVGRSFSGEAGKVTVSDEGHRAMHNLWVYKHDKPDRYAEMLSLRIGFKAAWLAISEGDAIPEGAVASKARQIYVARNDKAAPETGMLTVTAPTNKGDVPRMDQILCHHDGVSSNGEILVIQESSRELRVEILSCEGLHSPEYRFGDHVRKGLGASISPYVEVDFLGSIWRSGHQATVTETNARGKNKFSAEFHEVVYIDLKPDDDLNKLTLKFRVKDKRRIHDPVVGDPAVGECSLALTSDNLGVERCAMLQRKEMLHRKDRTHGSIQVLVEELKASEQKPDNGPQLLPLIGLEEVGIAQLNDDLWKGLLQNGMEGECAETLSLCVDALTSSSGGILLVVLGSMAADPEFEWLDGGAFMDLALGVVGNIHSKGEAFRDLLSVASTTSSPAEPWEKDSLQKFLSEYAKDAMSEFTMDAVKPGNVARAAKQLVGQPKGGAMILSARGTIRAASANLSFSTCPQHRLCAVRGQRPDLRLSTAVSIAHSITSGVVFSRAEDGHLYAFVASSQDVMPCSFHYQVN